MSHTHNVPLTLNGNVIGSCVLHEDTDGHLVLTTASIQTPQAGDTLLKLLREGIVTGFNVDAPPATPAQRQVDAEVGTS